MEKVTAIDVAPALQQKWRLHFEIEGNNEYASIYIYV